MNGTHVGINRVLEITFVNLLIARLGDEEFCSNTGIGDYRYGLETKTRVAILGYKIFIHQVKTRQLGSNIGLNYFNHTSEPNHWVAILDDKRFDQIGNLRIR